MNPPTHLYDLLTAYAASETRVSELNLGLVWTLCKAEGHLGLAMSPSTPTRTLTWPGTLAGKTLGELAAWLTAWEPYQATVGMAAVNCSLNHHPLPAGLHLNSGNLAVFEHFLPQLRNQKVVVIGHYPGIERYADDCQLSILERQPQLNDYPDPACEFLLPTADWVFLSASTITNKTFPRLAQLAEHATTVLMGPSLPWFPQWHEFGINYLAGLAITDADKLTQTAAEGGGVRIFENGACYHLVELTPSNSMAWLKSQIAEDYAEKQKLTLAMEQWYAEGNKVRFPAFTQLQHIVTRLSHMDSSYKRLWDESLLR